MVFIRFVIVARDATSGSLRGVIRAAGDLDESGALDPHESKLLREAFAWLNHNLPVPPQLSRTGARNAICWFKSSASDAIDRMWEVVAVLRDHGIPVDLVKTSNPGKILYEDESQVLARPHRDRNASFR